MSSLALVKSEDFHGVQCDFWYDNETNNDNYYMTAKQLGMALEYADPQKGVDNMISRNPYLKTNEFSVSLKMRGTDNKEYETRVFTEDGIYEVTMLAKTPRAREFRAKVRQILKELRKGTIKAVKPIDPRVIEARAKNAEARLLNARRKDAEFILKAVNKQAGVLSSQAVELLTINALELVAGQKSLPRPEIDKHYTAGDIASEIGVSANMVGRIAKQYNLKTAEYGVTVLDKSPYSNKQVETFRYNEKGRQGLLEAFKQQSAKNASSESSQNSKSSE
jgi:prophage antirepressor-like protein